MEARAGQPLKAVQKIEVTLAGRWMEVRAVHSQKA